MSATRTESTNAEPISAPASGHGSGFARAPVGPVFVGGLDRSGKTTMAAFLTSHPRIAIPPVGSNMETYFLNRFGDLGRPENLERCLSAMMRYSHIRVLDPDLGRIRRRFAEGPPSYERLFASFLQDYAQRLGKPRWGAQSGLIEAHADSLFAVHDGAKIVHMVRDPRDRYEASLSMWPDGKGRAGGATARWRYSTGLADRNRRRHPDRYLVVRFEDLVYAPERILREVCAFLGETFSPAMLTMQGAPERRDRLMARSSGDIDGFLSEAYIGRFRGRVSPGELAFIQLHAGRRMAAFGYRPDELSLSFGERMRLALRDWPAQAARMTAWRAVEEMRRRAPARSGRDPDPQTIVDDGGDR
jgi:hypothetical protein